MRHFFFFFFTFIFVININATTYSIRDLNNDSQSIGILSSYLKQTNLQIENLDKVNFILGTKENITSVNKDLFTQIEKYKNDSFIIRLIDITS